MDSTSKVESISFHLISLVISELLRFQHGSEEIDHEDDCDEGADNVKRIHRFRPLALSPPIMRSNAEISPNDRAKKTAARAKYKRSLTISNTRSLSGKKRIAEWCKAGVKDYGGGVKKVKRFGGRLWHLCGHCLSGQPARRPRALKVKPACHTINIKNFAARK